jgi:RNA-directed DNA polymerase
MLPLFANRYLHELDRYWWENYGNLTKRQKEQRRRNHAGNCRLLRYADDFVLLTNGPREEAYRLRGEFQAFLHEKLKLELSAEKTRVTHINDGFDFLGFNIRRYNNREDRNRHVLLVKPSEKSVDRLKAKIRQMTAKTHAPDNPYLKMLAVNLVLRGWSNYYQHVNAKAVLQGLDYWINDRMLRWFANHHEYGIRNALTDYQHREGERKNLAVKTPKGQLLFLYLMRDKPLTRYVDEKRTNPYLAPWQTALLAAPEQEDLDLEHTWNGAEYAPGWQAARTARLELDQGRCVRCGTTDNVDVHHLKQRRWRRRRQGNDDISNLRTLCKDCHTAVHQGVIAVAGTGAPDALIGARPVRREA